MVIRKSHKHGSGFAESTQRAASVHLAGFPLCSLVLDVFALFLWDHSVSSHHYKMHIRAQSVVVCVYTAHICFVLSSVSVSLLLTGFSVFC